VSGGDGYFRNTNKDKNLSSFKHEREIEKDGNGWWWNFHKCKGNAANERKKRGRKDLKHEVLI
jgi:hypothetical protein